MISVERPGGWSAPWAGAVLLGLASLAAGWFFLPGLQRLVAAWQTPEYSHGPLIPLISLLLFLRHLRDVPPAVDDGGTRWPGVALVLTAVLAGMSGRLAGIGDIVVWAILLWTGGVMLIALGWQEGRRYWPAIVHLVFLLPLPGLIHYKLTAGLQLVSSELGVSLLRLAGVPVFLAGNIIDLGGLQLHVAEACSGLRYLFPILSFSYVVALLHAGPSWHRLLLLLAAVPVAVTMNALRIALTGILIEMQGPAHAAGLLHVFEGWVMFLVSVLLLAGLAWGLRRIDAARNERMMAALDLDLQGVLPQVTRLAGIQAERALALSGALPLAAVLTLALLPEREAYPVARRDFSEFPHAIGSWVRIGPDTHLPVEVARVLGAQDTLGTTFARSASGPRATLFAAWYDDQSKGGVHSPEICLPGAGWEIAALERRDISAQIGAAGPFRVNRAVIQRGSARHLVFYWFDQKGRKIAWDFAAKAWLVHDSLRTGRSDGALVRLSTPILAMETDDAAEARLLSLIATLAPILPEFIPAGSPAGGDNPTGQAHP